MEFLKKDLFDIEKRGGLLSILLILWIVSQFIFGLLGLFTVKLFSEIHKLPQWFYFMVAVVCLINIPIGIYLWNWKKIGVYALWASSLISAIISFIADNSILNSVSNLIIPVLLTLIFIPKWKYFK
jgi:hypothetical protein